MRHAVVRTADSVGDVEGTFVTASDTTGSETLNHTRIRSAASFVVVLAACSVIWLQRLFGEIGWTGGVLRTLVKQEEALRILNGAVPLLAATVAFGLMVQTLSPRLVAPLRLRRVSVAPLGLFPASLLMVAAGWFIYVIVGLWRGESHVSYAWLFLLVWMSALVVLVRVDRRLSLYRFRHFWPHLAFVTLVFATFLLANAHDLGSWYYSAIGDEYAFYDVARSIASGQAPSHLQNLFSQRGVYGNHPVASSYYQASIMWLLGFQRPAWLFSSTLVIGLSLFPLYFLARGLCGWKVAVPAVVVYASSHYLFAFAHLGYNSSQALLPTLITFAAVLSGLRNGSLVMMFLGGSAAALGFYTFYPSRAALPIVLLWLALAALFIARRVPSKSSSAWLLLAVFVFGAVFCLSPFVAVNKAEIVTKMLEQSAVAASEAAGRPPLEHYGMNALRSFFAFSYNTKADHYVWGSLMDTLSAALATLGLGYCLARPWHLGRAFLLLWFTTAVIATGVVSQYNHVAITRMFFVVPVMAIFAGTALAALAQAVQAGGIVVGRWIRPYPLLLVGATVVIVFANVQRFWFITPGQLWTTEETVIVRALMEQNGCRGGDTLILAPSSEGLISAVLATQPGLERRPRIVAYKDIIADDGKPRAACYLFLNKDRPEAKQAMALLRAESPELREVRVHDRSGKRWIPVLTREHSP